MGLAKSQKNQTYVLKINTGYLSKYNWDLTLKLSDIRKQPQLVVALGSSQVLRWMEQLQGRQNNDIEATSIKKEIKYIKQQENNLENKQRINELYNQLYEKQFQQDYLMLIMSSKKDYKYACKHGFNVTIDYGYKTKTVRYRRLLGTAGSIKKSTIIFINEKIYDEIMKRINNGRYEGPQHKDEAIKIYNDKELNYKFIPAKLSAYFALQCSASISVPWPRIIVVNDAITKFKDIVRVVKDSGNKQNFNWPDVSNPMEMEIEYNLSDGMGLITPEMSAMWAEALNEGTEPLSGFNTRCAFLKGMVFTVPFKKFAEEIAHSYTIIDAWGDERDIRDADVILTISMLKLWNSYAGYEDYYTNCMKNGYEFCIAKSTPHELRNIHTTNYQYLQDFRFTDEQIEQLVQPTVNNIKDCLGFDWRKLILYLCGTGLDEKNVIYSDPMCKAIMANPKLIEDPYVRTKIGRMIQKRINSAKIGVLDVEGDYAIAGNDPYSLMQSIFGMEITGLLKRGECYHKYWIDKNADEVCVFRAPMTSIENVCKLKIVDSVEMEKWYGYIKTCILLNSWDTTAIRCNGEDFDSDANFTTNNAVLLEAFEYKDTLMCIQDSMPKKVPTEEDYITSDINGFGDSIGSVTNKATNMISLRENFKPDSEEFKRLTYRISTMMNYQQNAIDRIKGVVARPVPKEWLQASMYKINENSDDENIIIEKNIEQNIAADIKPWFFIYRYSEIKANLDKYIKAVQSNCKIRFGIPLDVLLNKKNQTKEESDFIYYYNKYMPVSRAPGTMNRICWKIEDEFQSMNVLPFIEFDYSILKNNAEYTQEEFNSINELYNNYNNNVQLFLKGVKKNDSKKEERELFMTQLKENFAIECSRICPNAKVLTNVLIDVCYSSEKNKAFAWEIAGEEIFMNVLRNSNNTLNVPCKDENGDFKFNGRKFILKTIQIEG